MKGNDVHIVIDSIVIVVCDVILILDVVLRVDVCLVHDTWRGIGVAFFTVSDMPNLARRASKHYVTSWTFQFVDDTLAYVHVTI
jgi:hypothetical protein